TRRRTGPAHPSESFGDQLARGGELLRSAVELAVQLAPAQLREHLPHARRLREAERGEVVAVKVEAHVPQPFEVGTQRGMVPDRKRIERRIGPGALDAVDD